MTSGGCDNRPRMLIINFYPVVPPNSGAKVVIYNRIRYLAEAFEITFAAPAVCAQDVESMDELQSVCETRGISCHGSTGSWFGRFLDRWRYPCVNELKAVYHEFYRHHDLVDLVENGDFDIIELHHAHWYHPILASTSASFVLVNHNDETGYYRATMWSHFRSGRWMKALRTGLNLVQVHRQVTRALKHSDLVVALSPREAEAVSAREPAVSVNHNYGGVDIDYYRDPDIQGYKCKGNPVLVYVGALFVDHIGDAAIEFAREIFPEIRRVLPEARFLIVGDYRQRLEIPALAEGDTGVEVTGLVDDVRTYLAGSDIAVVPLRYGAGVRFKIMEALAMSLPVVSTAKGAEGLGLTAGREIEGNSVACATCAHRTTRHGHVYYVVDRKILPFVRSRYATP